MLRLRSFLPVAGALALLAVFGSVLRDPAYWPAAAAAAILVVAGSEWLLLGRQSTVRFWSASAVPLMLLSTSAVGLLLFVNTDIARQFVLVAATALAVLSWESVRRYVWERDRYHPEQLENTLLLVSLVTVWMTAAFAYRLLLDPTLLPPPLAGSVFGVSTAVVLGLVFVLERVALWATRYERSRVVWPLNATTSLLIGEFFWLLNFLPHAPDVKAFTVTVLYYCLVMLGRAHLDGTLSRNVVRRYVAFAVATFTLALATAQWVV